MLAHRRTSFRVASLIVATAVLIGMARPATTVAADPPPNDTVATATEITSLPFLDAVDMSSAASSFPWSSCNPYFTHTIFYRIVVTSDTRVTLSTAGSDFDTVLDLFQQYLPGLAPYTCNNDDGALVTSKVTATLSGGQPYVVMITNNSAQPAGTAQLVVEAVAPPPNDDFDSATGITAVPFVDHIDTAMATRAADDPVPANCGDNYGTGPTTWWALTLPETATIDLDTAGSQGDTRLSIWTGTRGALTQVACNNNTPQGSYMARLRFTADAGTTYYVLEDWGGGMYPTGGSLALVVEYAPPPPANDSVAAATSLAPLPFSESIDTSSATADPSDPPSSCFGTPLGVTVWYQFTSPDGAPIRLETSADYVLAVEFFTGTPGDLTSIGCGHYYGGTFDPEPGQTVYVLMGNPYGTIGGLLSVTAQPALDVTVVIDPTARVVTKTGLVTITGTITCNMQASVSTNSGELSQKVGRYTVRGQVWISTLCDGTVPFSLQVAGDSGPFTPGKADIDLRLHAYSWTTGEIDEPSVNQVMSLKGSK